MKIAILKERASEEKRVAISPETAKLFVKDGHTVWVEHNAGKESGFDDAMYIEAGAKISKVPLEITSDADIILKVQLTPDNEALNEVSLARKGAIIIGMLAPFSPNNQLDKLQSKSITSFAMEFVPRTTKAQSMDVLSSQANLAGFRAVIEACYLYNRATPMFMTAAGTIQPAKVLVIGVGVAGLQAIATAKRLGAIVTAYDVRAESKEQAESLGAKFISPDLSANFGGSGGYAREVSTSFKEKQDQLMFEHLKKNNIVITTAQIPGKDAPRIITSAMVETMQTGSIIMDLAAASGGNCEVTKPDKIVEYKGVKVAGFTNLASRIAGDASKLYAKNVYNFVKHMLANGNKIDLQDEILKEMLLTHDGKIVNDKLKKR